MFTKSFNASATVCNHLGSFIFKQSSPSLIHKRITEGVLAPSRCGYRLVLSSAIMAAVETLRYFDRDAAAAPGS